MFFKWRRKILPKMFMEISDELAIRVRKEGRKCPFLTPFVWRSGRDTVEHIPQECMRDRCAIWDAEEGQCSIPVIAKMLREKGDS
ncbi:MAG: hypothetical protein M0021_09660 [Clostridia bacterium]|nr:hypothetical protein [Clostridia bacterium]